MGRLEARGSRLPPAAQEAIFRASPQPSIVLRVVRDEAGAPADLEIVDVNDAGGRAVGSDVERLLGLRLGTFSGRSVMMPYLSNVVDVLSSGVAHSFETDVAPNGRRYLASVIAVGEDLAAIVAADITERRASEDRLRASEALYRGALEALQDGVMVHDRTGAIVAASPSAGRILGFGTSPLHLPAFRDGWVSRRQDGTPFPLEEHPALVALRTGEPVRDVLVDLAHTDGRRVWLRINAEPLRDADGAVTGVVGSFSDVTEARRAQVALAASEARYRSTLDDLVEGVQILDPDWHWTYVNHTAATRRNGELSDVIGRSLFEVYPGIEISEIFERFRRCMTTGQPERFEAGYTFVDGATDWFDFSVQRVPEGIFVLTLASTERRLAHDALLAREEQLRRTTESLEEARAISGLGVWRRDLVTGEAEWSPELFAFYGFDPAGPVPSLDTLDRLLGAGVLAERDAVVAASAATGLPWQFEFPVTRPDGETRWMVQHGVTETDADGRPRSLHGTALDITDRKRAEDVLRRFNEELERRVVDRTAELQAANEELRSFTYSVSHDLRAPLRSIAGFSRILELRYSDQLDEEGRHRLHNIVSAGESMGRVIDDLLAYSRLGREVPPMESVPLGPVMDRLRLSCAETLAATGGTLDVAEPLASPIGDATLLEVVLQNLVQNALLYRRPNVPPRVGISAARHGDAVTIEVADNGMGIPEDGLDRIFEPFQRLATDEAHPGTGIGLAIVRKSVRTMNGRVSVTSEVGVGSTFRVELPAG